jgi:RND family efflux transporter MFP subunit
MKIALAGLILAAIVGVGCGPKNPDEAAAASHTAPVAVRTLTAATAAWPNVYEAVGTVRARTSAAIASKVMGYVREVRVDVGNRVRAGQTLVVLDSRDLDAAYRQAEAARHEARSAVPEADNAVAGAKASLDLAQATWKRMKDLLAKDSISNQEFDEASARLKLAQSGYAMAISKRSQLQAKIAQAQEAFTSAEVMRSYAQLTAPFAGTVTQKTVDPGALATPGAPLLTLEREGEYRIEASVEESKLSQIHLGQPVTVLLDTVGHPVAGRVSEIVPAVDAASRAFTVKIDLPAAPSIRSGLFGRAQFSLGTRSVLAVPATATSERGQLTSVFVADGGHARLRFVTLGQRRDGQAEVLSGLEAGERVVFPVPPDLADGAPVEVRP